MVASISGVDAGARFALQTQGAFADLRALPEELRAELRGIAPSTATNSVIRGAELDAVFQKLDVAAMRTPASQRVLDALRANVAENRARTEREGALRFQGGEPDLKTIHKALIDTGYADSDLKVSVERFQRDAGLPATGRVDQETLSALAASAPAPGQQIERVAEWDRVWGDHRADVTIALSPSHDAERAVYSGLRERGFKPLTDAGVRSMSDEDRRTLGLTDDRYDPSAQYFVRSQDGEHAVVRLLAADPRDEAAGKASLARAMRQDEVVIYAGAGSGKDALDPAPKVETATTGLGRVSRRGADQDAAGRPAYQLMIFSGRPPELPGRSISDVDTVAATRPAHAETAGPRAIGFLDAVLLRQSNNAMIAEQSQIVSDHLRKNGFEGDTRLATGAYAESGFLTNPGNRRVADVSGAK